MYHSCYIQSYLLFAHLYFILLSDITILVYVCWNLTFCANVYVPKKEFKKSEQINKINIILNKT